MVSRKVEVIGSFCFSVRLWSGYVFSRFGRRLASSRVVVVRKEFLGSGVVGG